MTFDNISNIRLQSQAIAGNKFSSPKEVVGWMGAMQAQDFAMAMWAIGVRLSNATAQDIENALNSGQILRTHLLRPTWHFVASEDIWWMLELTAPQIRPTLRAREKELGITDVILKKSKTIFEKILVNGKHLTRDEIATAFNAEGIDTHDGRLSHILQPAELEGLICSGQIRDNKLTYCLLEEVVPNKKLLSRDEALAELAKRYFTSHCPATLRDFVWWSGLSVADAKKALEFNKTCFVAETIETEQYWFPVSFVIPGIFQDTVHFLPAYDEFLISYRERKASFSLVDNKKVISNNGIFRPVIVINGQVAGLWKRTSMKDKVAIETSLFIHNKSDLKMNLKNFGKNFQQFLKKEVVLLVCILLFVSYLSAQSLPVAYTELVQKAESLYKTKDFKNSAQTYSEAFKALGWKGTSDDRYNAACSWALCNTPDSAFYQLNKIAVLMGYKNYKHITTDSDLNSLHPDQRWQTLIDQVKLNKEKAEANLNKPLAAKLDSIFEEDQKYRLQLGEIEKKYGLDSKELKALWKTIEEKDSINLIKVEAILDTYGWLGADIVGENGNSALFLVIQHSDLPIQEKYLPMMREAVKNSKAAGSNLALLEDRIALRQGKRQIYGSQIGRDTDTKQYFLSPLEDPDNVDKRRAEVGLSPLATYLNHWNLKWDVEQYKKDLPALEEKLKSKK